MRKYTTTGHAADVQIYLEAGSLPDLFRAGLEGVAHILKPGVCKKSQFYTRQQAVDLKATDRMTLLIDFLSAVLTASRVHRVVFCNAVFSELTATKLTATISGVASQNFDTDIKGVVCQDKEIKKRNGALQCTLMFTR